MGLSAVKVGPPRVAGLPPGLWLGAIVAASAGVRIALAHRVVAPWIMVDELIYSDLAKSFAAHGHFLVRGVPSNGYGFVYPVLIAPAFALFGAVPRAYAVAKDINAVVMSLAAVPAYLLARRLVRPLPALAAAAMSVAIPSLLYTGMLMTENAFYPLFLLTALALMLALERPTPLRQVLLLALCAVSFFTRAQAIALVPAVLVAPLLHGWVERDLRSRLRRFQTLYAVVGAAILLVLAVSVARGRSPLSFLGAYRAAVNSSYTLHGSLHYLLWHVAELDLYVGIVPLAALLTLWLAPRSVSPRARAYAAASLPLVVFFLIEVAVFASAQSGRIEERNDFYLAPLMLIALVALAEDNVISRARRPVLAAALMAGALPVAVPFARFVNRSAVSDTFGLLPWWWLGDRGVAFGTMRFVALAIGLGAGVAFVLLPRRFALAFAAPVAAYFVCASLVVENGRHGIHQASVGSLGAGIRLPHPDWIDRAVGRNAKVAFLWHYTGETRPLWNNEFFSRSVGAVYTVDGPDAADGGLPETPVREREDGILVSATGTPRVAYAVSYTDIAGARVARDPGIGLALYRVNGPLVVLTRITGLYSDTWSGRRVTYRRLRCTGGQLSVRLGTDEHLFSSAQRVTATIGGKLAGSIDVLPAEQRIFGVPLEPDAAGACSVTFTMKQLRVPARVQPGNTDSRRLGAHFLAFDFSR
ncbi:MAG: glycosyltransferase family 39 protein [Gaiellaceae bacterium]